jgi:hypothetical protein
MWPEAEDAAIAPEQVHGERHEAEAERLAQRLDEGLVEIAPVPNASDSTVTVRVKSASASEKISTWGCRITKGRWSGAA